MSAELVQFRLPDVGEGLEEAEIVAWFVTAGQAVERDQPLVEILTDKAQVELPSPTAGRVESLAVAVGDIVKVGTVLVTLSAASPPATAAPATAATPRADSPPSASPPAGGPALAPAAAPRGAPPKGLRPKASPSTRRLAAEMGVELAAITGTGPGGRILADDVRGAATAPGPAASAAPLAVPATTAPSAPAEAGASVRAGTSVGVGIGVGDPLGQLSAGVHPLRGIRRLTAQSMAQSWSSIPHITGMDEVDATALLDARRQLREHAGERAANLTPLVLLCLAAVRALRRFPLVNASIDVDAGTITVHDRVHLGIAVATPDGLVVPIVADADRYGPIGLGDAIAGLSEAARTKRLRPEQLRGGTFTVTNYGALGGRFATPIIRPGEVGIVGFGRIRERPLVVGGEVVARPALPVVFSADHRLIDGDLSVAFQEHLLGLISRPLTLLSEV